MKKQIITLLFFFCNFLIFAYDSQIQNAQIDNKNTQKSFIEVLDELDEIDGLKIIKTVETQDYHQADLFQITKSEYTNNYDYFVYINFTKSEEGFFWFFENLAEAMEHLKWFNTIEIEKKENEDSGALAAMVLLGLITLNEAKEFAQSTTPKIKIIDKRDD